MIIRLSGPIEALINGKLFRPIPDEKGLSKIEGPITKVKFSGELNLLGVVEWGDFKPTSCAFMFASCINLVELPKDPPDLSVCESMMCMFEGARFFNQPIGDWNTFNVSGMYGLFWGATAFNQPIGNWNVSNVKDMSHMFQNAVSFNQPIGNWDTGNVTNMWKTFYCATSFEQDLSNWNVSNVKDMGKMFKHSKMAKNKPHWWRKNDE
jgi:surface protein